MFAQNVYGCKFMSCIHKKNMNHENPPKKCQKTTATQNKVSLKNYNIITE